jgi:hypothetical protein
VVVGKHASPAARVTCVEVVTNAASQALTSWHYSRHRDLKNSIYALYPQRKKDAFKISRVDPQIFIGAVSHNMILSLDLSSRLLIAQRDIHYLRVDIEDTLCAHQRMYAGQDSEFYYLDQDT